MTRLHNVCQQSMLARVQPLSKQIITELVAYFFFVCHLMDSKHSDRIALTSAFYKIAARRRQVAVDKNIHRFRKAA